MKHHVDQLKPMEIASVQGVSFTDDPGDDSDSGLESIL